MSQLVMMIVRIDDMNKPEELSEVWHQSLPRVSLEGLEVAHYLDGLEEQVRAAWDQSLAQPDLSSPTGISANDWERVLQARCDEPDIECLRRLGPETQSGEIGAVTSDVGVRRPEKRRWPEICTAMGYRYLSGTAQAVPNASTSAALTPKRPMIYWSPAARSLRVCTGAKPKADGLAALRTLLLNGGWDLYWEEQQVLPLAVPKAT